MHQGMAHGAAMKALAFTKPHAFDAFAITEHELPRPTLRPDDILVDVRAFSANPVDYKVRSSRTADAPVVLGWDGAGVVVEVGPAARGFAVGDEVYFAGDLTRAGTYAELVAVDARLVATKPRSLSFAEAAALPLTSLTAWEALIDHGARGTVLVVGGAGGVGSMAIQLLATTDAKIVATASRPETTAWCKELGAHEVIDHRKPLAAQVRDVDFVFGTTHTAELLPQLVEVLRPFGALALIDDPPALDIVPLKRKALTVHWELMFTKSLYGVELASQGEILAKIAALVDAGRVRSTLRTKLAGFTAENVRHAHALLESGTAIGKIVVERQTA